MLIIGIKVTERSEYEHSINHLFIKILEQFLVEKLSPLASFCIVFLFSFFLLINFFFFVIKLIRILSY